MVALTDITQQTPSQMKRFFRPKLLIAIIVVAALVAAGRYFNSTMLLRSALTWIASLGPLAPVLFVGLYIAAAVLFIPGAILTIGAGVLFGLVKGTICVSIGATLGATCAFLIGRYVARDWVARKLEGSPNFKAIDRAVAHEGWKIVGLARLSPVFPFNLLNYAFGLTDVSLKDYFLASWIGMIPGIIMYVYIGTLAGDLARVGSGSVTATPGRWALEIVGLMATVGVAVYVTAVARRALRARTVS